MDTQNILKITVCMIVIFSLVDNAVGGEPPAPGELCPSTHDWTALNSGVDCYEAPFLPGTTQGYCCLKVCPLTLEWSLQDLGNCYAAPYNGGSTTYGYCCLTTPECPAGEGC